MILPAVRDPRLTQARALGGHAMGAARPLTGAARFAAYVAGQAGAVAHVAEHDLGAAAYAIRAAQAAAAPPDAAAARKGELAWQRDRPPEQVRDLVLADQLRRNDICWHVFGE
ncbi:MAG: putative immunity protein [Tetrasphaera sp.]